MCTYILQTVLWIKRSTHSALIEHRHAGCILFKADLKYVDDNVANYFDITALLLLLLLCHSYCLQALVSLEKRCGTCRPTSRLRLFAALNAEIYNTRHCSVTAYNIQLEWCNTRTKRHKVFDASSPNAVQIHSDTHNGTQAQSMKDFHRRLTIYYILRES